MTKTMMKNQWTLWSYKPFKDYPSIWYFWIDPNNIIQHSRSVESLGYCEMALDIDLWIDKEVNPKIMRKLGCKKVKNSYAKMTQEELSKGWLTTH